MPSRLSICSLSASLSLFVLACILPAESLAGGLKLPIPGIFHSAPEQDCVQQLADAIDKLEGELNYDGTIIAKTPDIWGEARLTKHRHEFEEQLAKQIDQFDLRLQASIRRSDQAFLANALAIQRAITDSAGNAPAPSSTGTFNQVNAMLPTSIGVNASAEDENGEVTPASEGVIFRTQPGVTNRGFVSKTGSQGFVDTNISIEPTIFLDQLKRYVNHLNEIRRVNEGDDTADSPGYAMRLVRIPVSLLPGDKTRVGHGAEITVSATPVISRELLPETFRTLVMNELIDKTRVPLGSVLNNRNMRSQNEALEDLLDVFRKLLTKVESRGKLTFGFDEIWTLVKMVTGRDLTQENGSQSESSAGSRADSGSDKPQAARQIDSDSRTPDERTSAVLNLKPQISTERDWDRIDQLLMVPSIVALFRDRRVAPFLEGRKPGEVVRDPIFLEWIKLPTSQELVRLAAGPGNAQAEELLKLLIGAKSSPEVTSPQEPSGLDEKLRAELNRIRRQQPYNLSAELQNAFLALYQEDLTSMVRVITSLEVATATLKSMFQSYGSSGRPHGSDLFPATSWSRVYGIYELLRLALEARDRILGNPKHWYFQQVFAEPAAIDNYLKEHFDAAYCLLELSENLHLWQQHCTRELLLAIRRVDRHQLDRLRNEFFMDLQASGYPGNVDETIGIYAWAIIVEAALMNDALIHDMRRVGADRGQNMQRLDPDTLCPVPDGGGAPPCACSSPDGLNFFEPEPSEQARQAFADYVRCRWPIQVFALDPVTQDQNVADAFSMRRELQLALALAFATGNTSIQNVTRFVRRMELDMETIALNRTAVGFTHGPDTFGWRFAPRVQTPDEEGNLKVVFRDLLLGRQSKDTRLKQHRIEPGMRECYAMIVMPSFVPYVELDIRSDWYKLTSPDRTRTSAARHVDWSRQIRDMKVLANRCCQHHAYQYRRGEIARLYRRIDQLGRKLPIQTVSAQMPIENSLGGSRLFRNGKDTLHPDLHYWYGVAGIQPAKETTLFLKGKNFSVHDTHVLAGDRKLDFKMISREILQVTVPAGVQQNMRPEWVREDGVDIHVATPYGITGHLHVPIDKTTQKASPGFAWAGDSHQVKYRWREGVDADGDTNKGKVMVEAGSIQVRRPHQHAISVPANAIPHPAAKLTISGRTTSDFAFTTPIFTYEIAEVPLSDDRKKYVVDGVHFVNLHRGLRTAVDSHARDAYSVDRVPKIVEVELSAVLEFDGVEVSVGNKLTIQVLLEKKQ